MSETLIPTMDFRWWAPSAAAFAEQPSCAVLQQRFEKPSGGYIWVAPPFKFGYGSGILPRKDEE